MPPTLLQWPRTYTSGKRVSSPSTPITPAGAAAAGDGIGVSDKAMAALHVVSPGCLVHLEAR